ncbi:Probable amino-acid metabolite efflux pump [Serratia liquefaciens]|jgi:drug/metabolite transporter (DMT)-like permease|uniref:DMT family transporter n=1 Tax=Serratia liquefaciens TaxID=614 RepID=UPI000D5149C8|nr:DMT family transporter [Serratia liquefaciens]PVD43275.1 EamA family transporter [Serratia liquefaciens]QHT52060.1 DMT family transporter [Serratia liquefaciens]RYM62906.1 EamA family transporter [Serratia liquefaciens]CAI0732675.1 Probable amino-acid metabolite efflux pump [Serratia liquefaciens]CAI0855360.1 Probable amino-acid metabolite efflux pump [Serratia liquefaciens]
MSARNNIDGKAGAAMVMICAIWGLQQVAIKAAEPDISAVLQIAIRSGIAALAVYLLARFKGEKFLLDPRTLLAGFGVGLSFALEFFFVSEGLRYTSASHMAVFLYTAPLFSAIGLHFFIRHERLSAVQWAGIAIAFGGVVLAISAMGESSGGVNQLRGDIYGLLAGLSWGGSTILIRTTGLANCSSKQTLLFQLTGACIVLSLLAMTMQNVHFTLSSVAWSSLVFQTVIVSFISYLIWFSLLRHYQASSLGILTFMTPIFGILAGVVILGEPLQIEFVLGSVLIVLGLIVVSCSYLFYFTRRIAPKI